MYRAASESAKAKAGGAGAGCRSATRRAQESAGQGSKEEGPIIDAEVVDEKK